MHGGEPQPAQCYSFYHDEAIPDTLRHNYESLKQVILDPLKLLGDSFKRHDTRYDRESTLTVTPCFFLNHTTSGVMLNAKTSYGFPIMQNEPCDSG